MSHTAWLLPLLCAGLITTSGPSSARARGSSSLELAKSTKVYQEPDKDSAELGSLARRSRVRVLETGSGKGCRYRWRRIAPMGWICAKARPSRGEATMATLPRLKNGALPLGRYGRVRKRPEVRIFDSADAVHNDQGIAPEKSMSVLRKGTRRINGKKYWRTADNSLIEARFISRYRPSEFQGAALAERDERGGLSLPLAWARPSEKAAPVPVFSAPRADAEVLRSLVPNSQVAYLGESKDGAFTRIAPGEWIRREESRRARRRAPPAEIRGDELWLDVDLDEQVLVAYAGERPIYATMISSGKRRHRTPPGKYRIERKVAQKTMASGESESEQYSVGGVPWIMYFKSSFALHGAYWHDRLGAPRSHGCVNLAPRDAHNIYSMVQPQVPAGWISANATPDNPGTLVHLRSARHPHASEEIHY